MAKEKEWEWFLALGIVFILFGFMIILFPVAGTFAIEVLFGIVLLIAGLMQFALTFQMGGWKGFLIKLLSGILYLGAGLVLLFYPLTGVIALTLFLGMFLVVDGILKVSLSFKLKPKFKWKLLLFDGLITLLLAILIIGGWPSDSTWVIGLLFGINMLFGGITSIVLSLAMKEGK